MLPRELRKLESQPIQVRLAPGGTGGRNGIKGTVITLRPAEGDVDVQRLKQASQKTESGK